MKFRLRSWCRISNAAEAYYQGVLDGHLEAMELIFEGEPLGLSVHQTNVLLDRFQCLLDDAVITHQQRIDTWLAELNESVASGS